MKITLELPDELARKFKATVPDGQRSKLIADLLSERLKSQESELERAAKRANTFRQVTEDMKHWEALNEVED